MTGLLARELGYRAAIDRPPIQALQDFAIGDVRFDINQLLQHETAQAARDRAHTRDIDAPDC